MKEVKSYKDDFFKEVMRDWYCGSDEMIAFSTNTKDNMKAVAYGYVDCNDLEIAMGYSWEEIFCDVFLDAIVSYCEDCEWDPNEVGYFDEDTLKQIHEYSKTKNNLTEN